MSSAPNISLSTAEIIQWYADMGLDDVIGAEPSDFRTWQTKPSFKKKPMPSRARAPEPAPKPAAPPQITGLDAPMPVDEAVALATKLAGQAENLATLKHLIEEFDGCPLKPGARNTVVCDGIEGAPLMVLGEAPGRDEDRIGRPFVGKAGQLLDKMLSAIGYSRFDDDQAPAFISNSIFWRPPGNRAPTKMEVAICLPFVHRMIELAQPKVLLLVGNTPNQTLFEEAPGITRARGKWKQHMTADGQEIPALPMFHPAFLLRQPIQKRLAWVDLRAARDKLSEQQD